MRIAQAAERRMIMDEIKDYPPYLDYPKPHKVQPTHRKSAPWVMRSWLNLLMASAFVFPPANAQRCAVIAMLAGLIGSSSQRKYSPDRHWALYRHQFLFNVRTETILTKTYRQKFNNWFWYHISEFSRFLPSPWTKLNKKRPRGSRDVQGVQDVQLTFDSYINLYFENWFW